MTRNDEPVTANGANDRRSRGAGAGERGIDRRTLLAGLGTAATAGLAGCAGFELQSRNLSPPVPSERPNAVYLPSHVEGMKMAGMAKSGAYKAALTYTYPHRFWLMTGTRRKKVEIAAEDSVHLMPVVWETETGVVPPDVNPQVAISQDGESVAQLAPWPMLSQPMGFHFGDNVQLDGEGTYDVEVSIGSPSARRTGTLADNEGNVSFQFEFEFAQSTLNEISFRDIPDDEEGSTGAVDPMGMSSMPSTTLPKPGDFPGDVRGTTSSGDAEFVVTRLDDATPFGGSEEQSYLAVSARTPYNRHVIPMMSLSATIQRSGEKVIDGPLKTAIDPDLGYHYGLSVPSVESGDELTITVDTPPQVARHEGYEMAFVEMDDASLTL